MNANPNLLLSEIQLDSDPATTPLFRVVNGTPIPIVPVDPNGVLRVADGVTYFSAGQAAEACDFEPGRLGQLWRECVRDIFGPSWEAELPRADGDRPTPIRRELPRGMRVAVHASGCVTLLDDHDTHRPDGTDDPDAESVMISASEATRIIRWLDARRQEGGEQ